MEKLKSQLSNTLQIRTDLLDKVADYTQLFHLIEQYIQELIDYDFDKLLLLLYRIDVSEKLVKDALEKNGPEKAAESIAQLIIDREQTKIKSRAKFKSSSDEWDFT